MYFSMCRHFNSYDYPVRQISLAPFFFNMRKHDQRRGLNDLFKVTSGK